MPADIHPVGVHLGGRYGIEVAATAELDADVLRVDRRDGPPWVARVFSGERPVADVEAEAALLRRLEEAGFPAERPAHARRCLAGRSGPCS